MKIYAIIASFILYSVIMATIIPPMLSYPDWSMLLLGTSLGALYPVVSVVTFKVIRKIYKAV